MSGFPLNLIYVYEYPIPPITVEEQNKGTVMQFTREMHFVARNDEHLNMKQK